LAANPPFNVVNAELELVTAAKEQGFPVMFRDWDRIRALVAALPGPERIASNLAWSCVAVAASAGLALITWPPAYRVLDDKAKLEFAWVTPTLVAIAAACVVIAGISFWFDNHVKRDVLRSSTHICEDMDAIASRYRAPKPPA